MAIQLVSTVTDTATNSDTNTWYHDMSAGGDMAIVVVSTRQSGDTGPSTETVTINGDSATLLSGTINNRTYVGIWYLKNPNAGNNEILMNINCSTGNHRTIGCVSYLLKNTSNDNPTYEGTDITNDNNVSVVTDIDKSGSMTIGIGVQRATSTISFNSGQTSVLNEQIVYDSTSTHFSSYKKGLLKGADSHGVTSTSSEYIHIKVLQVIAKPSGGAFLLNFI